jgi:hypothetical protein
VGDVGRVYMALGQMRARLAQWARARAHLSWFMVHVGPIWRVLGGGVCTRTVRAEHRLNIYIKYIYIY